MDSEQKTAKRRGNPALATGIIVILVAVIAISGWYFAQQMIQPRPIPVGTILGDLRAWDGRPVTVRGTVTNRLSIAGFKSYDIEDESGSIKIVTQRGIPPAGEVVTVTGVVNSVFTVGTMDFTIIMEPAAGDKAVLP